MFFDVDELDALKATTGVWEAHLYLAGKPHVIGTIPSQTYRIVQRKGSNAKAYDNKTALLTLFHKNKITCTNR